MYVCICKNTIETGVRVVWTYNNTIETKSEKTSGSPRDCRFWRVPNFDAPTTHLVSTPLSWTSWHGSRSRQILLHLDPCRTRLWGHPNGPIGHFTCRVPRDNVSHLLNLMLVHIGLHTEDCLLWRGEGSTRLTYTLHIGLIFFFVYYNGESES